MTPNRQRVLEMISSKQFGLQIIYEYDANLLKYLLSKIHSILLCDFSFQSKVTTKHKEFYCKTFH